MEEKMLSEYNELARVIMEGFVATTRELVGGHIQKDREHHKYSIEVEKTMMSAHAQDIGETISSNQDVIDKMNEGISDEL